MKNRYKWSELSVARIRQSIRRRLINMVRYVGTLAVPTVRFDRSPRSSCVLVANGPSLSDIDFSLLDKQDVYGMNRIYLNEKLQGKLKGIFLVNELVAEQFVNDFLALKIKLFVPLTLRKYFGDTTDHVLYSRFNPFLGGFGKSSRFHINPGSTVTYYALQILLEMGYRKVIIVGMDHNFGIQKRVNHEEVVQQDKHHFHPDYFPPGSKWDTPDIAGNDYWYAVAKRHYEKTGNLIVDATINGKCQVFKKSSLSKEL